MAIRILVYDSDLTHANNIITAISSGYGSDIASQCEIITTDPFVRAYTDSNIVAIIRGYAGWLGFEDEAKLTYNLTNYRVQTFFTTGLNSPQELFVCPTSATLPFIVLGGGGVTTNQTAYSVEFFDDYSVLSSYANGAILGKILKIKDTLLCSWWQARYRARVTASKNNVYDNVNGFGIINTTNAITYSGSIITDPYILQGDITMASVIQLRNPISKTYAEMLALILASGLKIGQTYYISDKAIITTAVSTVLLSPYVTYLTDLSVQYYYNIATDTLTSLPTLTELDYLKGITSDIQTQLNTKVANNAWSELSSEYLFNGTTDYISSVNTQKTKGFEIWVKPTVTNKALLNFGTNMQVTFNSSNVLVYGATFANITTWINGVAGSTLTLNVWNHIVATFDEITPTVLEFGRYSTTYLTGSIALFRQYNRVVTITDAINGFNNGLAHLANLKYEDYAASNTEIITNGTFTADSGWTKESGWTIDTGTGTAVGTNTNGYLYQTIAGLAGKKIKITYTLVITSGSVRLNIYNTVSTTRTTSGTYTDELYISQNVGGNFGALLFKGTAFTGTLDNVTAIKVGCVTEYHSDNIGKIGWRETQNNLHGIVNGSTLPTIMGKCPQFRYDVKTLIANTATALTSVVPKGYQIYAIRAIGTASLSTVSIGTSSGGTQIVNGASVATAASLLTLAGNVYSESTDTTLYAQHATAGQTLDLILLFIKIAR